MNRSPKVPERINPKADRQTLVIYLSKDEKDFVANAAKSAGMTMIDWAVAKLVGGDEARGSVQGRDSGALCDPWGIWDTQEDKWAHAREGGAPQNEARRGATDANMHGTPWSSSSRYEARRLPCS